MPSRTRRHSCEKPLRHFLCKIGGLFCVSLYFSFSKNTNYILIHRKKVVLVVHMFIKVYHFDCTQFGIWTIYCQTVGFFWGRYEKYTQTLVHSENIVCVLQGRHILMPPSPKPPLTSIQLCLHQNFPCTYTQTHTHSNSKVCFSVNNLTLM